MPEHSALRERRSRRFPVFERQPFHARELPNIMGDEDQPIRERDGGDEKVHAPDRLTIAFEIGADARIVFGCEIVKIERDELSQKTILCGAVLRDLRALERSVKQFGLYHAARTDGGARHRHITSEHSNVLRAQDPNHRVGVEEVPHSIP